jgi:hypothetical protein
VALRQSTRHVVCRESAALLHDLRTWSIPSLVHVRAEVRATGRDAPDLARHLGDVDESDVVVIDGVRVLSLEALAVDCALFLHPRDALVVVDHVLAVLTRADWRERDRVDAEVRPVKARLRARIAARPRRSRGLRSARAVVEWATPWSESAWESHLRWSLLVLGYRTVECQVVVPVDGTVYRTDLAIRTGPRTYLHLEFDGGGKYGADPNARSRAVENERRRQVAILSTGDRVVRFTASEAADRWAVAGKIAEALRGLPAVPREPVDDLLPHRDRP